MNIQIETVKRITCNMTAQEWGLFDMYGSGNAANELNRVVESTLNRGVAPHTAKEVIGETMETHEEFGANDTEAELALDTILQAFYTK